MKLPAFKLKKFHFTIAERWLLSLLCSLVLIIAATLYAALVFVGSFRADVAENTGGASVESLSREALKETIAAFDARIHRFESIKIQHETVRDPSR